MRAAPPACLPPLPGRRCRVAGPLLPSRRRVPTLPGRRLRPRRPPGVSPCRRRSVVAPPAIRQPRSSPVAAVQGVVAGAAGTLARRRRAPRPLSGVVAVAHGRVSTACRWPAPLQCRRRFRRRGAFQRRRRVKSLPASPSSSVEAAVGAADQVSLPSPPVSVVAEAAVEQVVAAVAGEDVVVAVPAVATSSPAVPLSMSPASVPV